MKVTFIDMVGLVAGAITTVSFCPQIIKIVKTKHARDISLYMYLLLTTGIFLWLIYGLLLSSLPIIISNAVALILCVFIIVMKVVYRRKD